MTTALSHTDNARDVLAAAQDHALRLGHDSITPEHLLLGIISVGDGVAAVALGRLGADLNDLSRDAEARAGRGTGERSGSDLPQSPETRAALELAVMEAHGLNHIYIGTEHLLLGLVSEGRNGGAQVLAARNITADRLRPEIVRLLESDRQSMITRRPDWLKRPQ